MPLTMIAAALALGAQPAADTARFSCSGTPRTISSDSARYELRNVMSDGVSFVSSTHTVTIRDSGIAGEPVVILTGRWRHARDGAESLERIVLCAHGLAPLSMDMRLARTGRRTAVFSGIRAEFQAGEGELVNDALPAVAIPREAFYIFAPMLAARGEHTVTVPVYRIEAETAAERFAWAQVRVVRSARAGFMQVDVTAFGGTLEYTVDTARGIVTRVRLQLGTGDAIEEVRL